MLQPLLVSAGDEEQVECTYLLENMDRWTDRQTDRRTDRWMSHNTSSPPPSLSSSLSDRGRGTSQDRKGKDTSEWGTLTSWRARMDEQVWDQVREFKGVGLT